MNKFEGTEVAAMVLAAKLSGDEVLMWEIVRDKPNEAVRGLIGLGCALALEVSKYMGMESSELLDAIIMNAGVRREETS